MSEATEIIFERDETRDTEKSFAYRPVGKNSVVVNGLGAYASKKKTNNEAPDRIVMRLERSV